MLRNKRFAVFQVHCHLAIRFGQCMITTVYLFSHTGRVSIIQLRGMAVHVWPSTGGKRVATLRHRRWAGE